MEYDGVDWQRREWVAVYSRRTFRVFLVERTLVWAPRTYEGKEVTWPALVSNSVIAFFCVFLCIRSLNFFHSSCVF